MVARADLLLLSTPLAGDALPGGVCPSLSNITLGSYLRHRGAAVEVLDPSVDLEVDPAQLADRPAQAGDILERTVDAVLDRAPRSVGVSCLSSVEGRFGVAFARKLKSRSKEIPVVLGGSWASPCAAEIVERVPEVDGVVAGPGEQAAAVLATSALDRPDDVPGLVRRVGDVTRHNPVAQTLEPAPTVDLSLMAHPERYQIFCWLTSRGCPFHCAFCTECLTSPGFSHYPIEKVSADVDAFRALGQPWYLWVCDPLFGVNRTRLAEVCERLAPAGMGFLAESRVDVLHPDDVPRLRDAGCTLIYFGLEAVTQPALLELDKIHPGRERFERYRDGARALVEACLRNDILPVMGVLQPVAGDTPADLEDALEFLRELASIAERLGPAAHNLGPCFHAFPLRFDRGAPYDGQEERLRAAGMTYTPVTDPLFEDRYLHRASPSVDAAQADLFRAAVRSLTPPSDLVRHRLYSSYPRPYVRFEV